MKNKPVLVLGAGGHAKVLLNALLLAGETVKGLLDPDTATHHRKMLGIPVLGGDELLKQQDPKTVLLVNGLGSISSTDRRRELFERLKRESFFFATVRHPAAVVANDVKIGEGAQIMAGAVIQPGTEIGPNSIINTGASIDHDCVIGGHGHIAPGCVLSGHVEVGEGAHVGSGSVIIQSVRIGERAVIGAGSLVLVDIPAGVTAFGSPAKVQ